MENFALSSVHPHWFFAYYNWTTELLKLPTNFTSHWCYNLILWLKKLNFLVRLYVAKIIIMIYTVFNQFVCLFGFNVALTSEVISRRCLLAEVILWQMCCHNGIPCHRHRTWHPTQSQGLLLYLMILANKIA